MEKRKLRSFETKGAPGERNLYIAYRKGSLVDEVSSFVAYVWLNQVGQVADGKEKTQQ